MSKKVVGIAAGEAHTLALTVDGGVFSWGRGTFGRLGNGKEEDQSFLGPVIFDASRKPAISSPEYRGGNPRFVGIAAGAYHSIALEDDGTVWSWGYNIYGQLGHGDQNSSVPCVVERFLELGDAQTDEPNADLEKKPLKVCSVNAGGMMSLAIDSTGGLWIWGHCPQPSDADDGEVSLVSSSVPLPVWDFIGHSVVKVACGNEHVLALVTAAETYTAGDLVCYSWGKNTHGQLGLGDTESRARPQIIMAFNEESPWSVYEIACGAFHTAVLTQTKSSYEEIGCRCWTFGLGENGQLGQGTAASTFLPEPVNGLPSDAVLISVDCGLFHTSVVSAAGDVWSWGMEKGLGLCPDASLADAGDALSPLRIQPSVSEMGETNFTGAVQVACGAAHTILVEGDGYKLWAWGRGRSGVLGRGHMADSFVPCVIRWPPLEDDLNDQGLRTYGSQTITRDNASILHSTEVDHRLSAALEEVQLLRSKLRVMERYASVLHVSIFGRAFEERNLPESLGDLDFFDIKKELENAIESADDTGLARMEIFYRNMLASVKDMMMKRRIREVVKECLVSLSRGTRSPPQ